MKVLSKAIWKFKKKINNRSAEKIVTKVLQIVKHETVKSKKITIYKALMD